MLTSFNEQKYSSAQKVFENALLNALDHYCVDLVDIYAYEDDNSVSIMHCGDNSFRIGDNFPLNELSLPFLKELADYYNVALMDEN